MCIYNIQHAKHQIMVNQTIPNHAKLYQQPTGAVQAFDSECQ